MENIYKYNAFISYRHISPDKDIADKLQKKLESYKPPKSLFIGKSFGGLRIFRDETELPTSSNLSNDIKSALENSEFLIVICSKTTQESRWCMEEIEYFKQLHNGNNANIITLVADGNPEDVFPPQLCNELIPVTDEHGNTTYQNHSIEPLAANVAGSTLKNSLRKLNTEFLRIAAPVLGCGYDDLYNREHRKKIRQIFMIGGMVLSLLLAFTIYNSAMLAKANKQTRLAQTENSKSSSILSENLWSYGDEITAIQTALSALPKGDDSRPVVSSATRVLANEIGAFKQNSLRPVLSLKHDKPVTRIDYAGNGTSIITEDDTGIYMWSTKTGELIRKFDNASFNTPEVFFDNTGIIKSSNLTKYSGSSFIMDDHDNIIGYKKEDHAEENTSESDFYIITGDDIIYKVNGKTGEFIWPTEKEGTANKNADDFAYVFSSTASISKAGDKFIKTSQDSKTNSYSVETFSTQTGELISTYTLEDYTLDGLSLDGWISIEKDKGYYLNSNSLSKSELVAFDIKENKICNPVVLVESPETNEDEYYSFLTTEATVIDDEVYSLSVYSDSVLYSNAKIHVHDYQSATLKWEYDLGQLSTSKGIQKFGKIYGKNANNFCDIIFAIIGQDVVLLNADTGELLKRTTLEGTVLDVYYSLDGMVYAITDAGSEIAIPIRNISAKGIDKDRTMKFKTYQFSNKPELGSYYNRHYALANKNSTEVNVYTDTKNVDFTEVLRVGDDNSVSHSLVNNSETYVVFDAYKELYVHDIEKNKTHKIAEFTDYGAIETFIDDTTLCVVYDNTLDIYDVTTRKKIYTITMNRKTHINKLDSVYNHIIVPEVDHLLFLDKKGNETKWEPKLPNKSAWREYDKGYIQSFYPTVNDSKLLALIDYSQDTGSRLEIYDLIDNTSVVLDKKMLTGKTKITITDVAWLSDNKISIAFSDDTIGYFDVNTGKCHNVTKYDIPSVLSITSLNDNRNIVVLCINNKIYEIDLHEKQISNDLKPCHSDDTLLNVSDKFDYIPEKNMLISKGWKSESMDSPAYIIDMEEFDVAYEVENYSNYLSSINSILVNEYNVAGYYPLYTAEELVSKAYKYLPQQHKLLGENPFWKKRITTLSN